MLAAVGHLVNHGYVALLRTSGGESRILLAPELLNNVAASIVLEARRNPRGLGSLEEQRVLSGDYAFPELHSLATDERDALLDSAVAMFLAHSVCFRETDPLNSRVYLVFPELINLKRQAVKEPQPVSDGVAYTVTGAVENVYASLVVLLGYTDVFTRTNQWRNQAEYVVGDDLVCGFRLEAEREGELDFVLYFGSTVGESVRMLFQGLFESFLARRDLTVRRFEPVTCSKGHQINRAVVREQLADGNEHSLLHTMRRAGLPAARRHSDPADQPPARRPRHPAPRCSPAVAVRAGAVPPHNVSGIRPRQTANLLHQLCLGQPRARAMGRTRTGHRPGQGRHYRNPGSLGKRTDRRQRAALHRAGGERRYCDRSRHTALPNQVQQRHTDGRIRRGRRRRPRRPSADRHREPQANRAASPPRGTAETALPALLHGRVYGDFRQPDRYFLAALNLILSLHGISPKDPICAELRQYIQGSPR